MVDVEEEKEQAQRRGRRAETPCLSVGHGPAKMMNGATDCAKISVFSKNERPSSKQLHSKNNNDNTIIKIKQQARVHLLSISILVRTMSSIQVS